MDYKKTIVDKGLKVQFVAKQIKISKVLLSYYLNGKRQMPLHIEDRLKKYLA